MQLAATQNAAATRASGSSFYLAMRILPRERRQAIYDVYSFCRAVDDIADGNEPRAQKMMRLREWRRRIEDLYCGDGISDLASLAHAIDRFDLRLDDFLAVIEGMEMDASEDIRAPDFARLEFYCDRVACAVGRLCVRIFGIDQQNGGPLAHHLGQALQLTNILRDLDEDALFGRLYLPLEALHLAGIRLTNPKIVVLHPAIGVACSFVARKARDDFAKAEKILTRCPWRAARAPKIMLEAYREILNELVARGWTAPRDRVRVSRAYLMLIVLRHAFI